MTDAERLAKLEQAVALIPGNTTVTAVQSAATLYPFIVFKGDSRWAACVDELRAGPKFIGLDTEFFEKPELRRLAESLGRDVREKDVGKPPQSAGSPIFRCASR